MNLFDMPLNASALFAFSTFIVNRAFADRKPVCYAVKIQYRFAACIEIAEYSAALANRSFSFTA